MKVKSKLINLFRKSSIFFLIFIGIPLNSVNINESPYGINAHAVENAVLGKIVSAGIKWIRIDIFWNEIEAVKGTYSYSNIDRVINYANSNGLSVLAAIAYTPKWANSKQNIHLPPDNVTHWKNFVQKTVQRYKSKVKYWSIWNEPNMEVFFAAGKDVFVNKIFIPAAQTIKAADAGAFIVGPDLAHKTATGQEWYFWLKYILDNAGQYIDIVSHHIYNDQSVTYLFELLESGDVLLPGVKEIVADAGHGGKPFWVTETGWHTYKVSETVQADRYLEFLQRMRQKGYPHKIFFYEIIDDTNAAIDPYGILRSTRSEKPAYQVYADFIAGLYPPLAEDDIIEDSKKCYAEEAVASRGDRSEQRSLLDGLLNLRADLIRTLPQGAALVRAYYRHGSEFAGLARADARIDRLGRQLLHDIHRSWLESDGQNLAVLQLQLTDQAGELLAILQKKDTSAGLRRTLDWCAGQLRLLERLGLENYKLHLPEQALRLDE